MGASCYRCYIAGSWLLFVTAAYNEEEVEEREEKEKREKEKKKREKNKRNGNFSKPNNFEVEK
jgi:hypothetical protein